MTRTMMAFTVAILLLSCVQDKPKINYEEKIDTTSLVDDRMKDTTKIIVAELPVKFDSTDVLLFAMGMVDLQERGGYSKFGSGSFGSNSDIASSYFHGDNLTGNFFNIVFQDSDGRDKKLTDKKIKIRSINFLRDIFEKTKAGYLLYSVTDRDSNRDNDLNYGDLEALYISKIDGSNFKKLTKELHDLFDWRLVRNENKIYFRTLEDRNKDGELNNRDQFHYYFIEFGKENYTLTEYNPVRLFE